MKRRINFLMIFIVLFVVILFVPYVTKAQGILENTIWKRDVPSENAVVYYHFIGNSKLIEIVSRQSSYSSAPINTIAEGIYEKSGNELKLIFKGGKATAQLKENQMMIGTRTYDLINKQVISETIPIAKEKCFSLPVPFGSDLVSVTTEIDSKYFGTYLFDAVWDTKIILSKTSEKSRYWVQVFKEGTPIPAEEDYYFDENRKNSAIKWGLVVENNKLLKTNPIINASVNKNKNEPVDNCLMLVFQYPDESVSYLFVVEINEAIYLIYNTMVYKKIL